jgi:hypothetical protein
MAWNSFAAGNRIYNGGSNAPNQGMTLDPTGYINRGLAPNSQQSQNRSGLAAGALSALRSQAPGGRPANSDPAQQNRDSLVAGQNSATNYSGALSGPKMGSTTASSTRGTIRIVKDEDLMGGMTNARRSYDLTRSQNRARAEQEQRNFQVEQGALRRNTYYDLLNQGNDYSGRGMTFSSGEGYYDDKVRDDANNQLKALQLAAQGRLDELQRNTMGALSEFDNTRTTAQQEQLYRNRQRAKNWTR